ncbi:AMP-binding protein [Roseobacter ponti]|uniref:AMP-binding protein n=1 Tax=Roseobacter ponti TaxID=1891787 RepID=A0A858SL97_9RHOB|nr:AMP-binding protein [Roseobacter ponti]QJF49664.1 AMP-binding protein [Roseobacter ponti]
MTPAANGPPQGTLRMWLDARAEDEATAYVFTDGSPSLTWSALHTEVRCLAQRITAKGVAQGESVAILHPNGSAAVTAFFAAVYGGFRATMINLAAGPDAISYALNHCGARVALVHEDVAELFDRTRHSGLQRLDPGAEETTASLHPVTAGDDALLMYTSGTTGRPKGVVHSHASLLAGGWTTTMAHGLTATDRGFCVLPVCHINGLCVSMMAALVSGGSVAMFAKFSARRFWWQLGETESTWFSVVPTIVSHLLHGTAGPDAETSARLRFGRSASSALAPAVHAAFEKRFSLPLIETMGLTETAAQILSNPMPPGVRRIGSPGIAWGNEVSVLGPDLRRCPPGTEGEIAVRGPNVMRRYLNDPDATAAAFAGDWLRSGDLGRQDEDGYFYITGRIKELIIKGGENIAPREIDEALYAHSDVIEAAAFARPCDVYGERVEAAVRVRDGSGLTDQMLIEICTARLGRFKAPDRVYFLPELPKGPSGKIQRLRLREIA